MADLEDEAGDSDALFKLYPDPNHGKFTISANFPKRGTFTIRVYNNFGLLIRELAKMEAGMTTEYPVDLGRVPSGLYMVVVEYRQKRMIRKMVVSP
jgi:hypothetical protein